MQTRLVSPQAVGDPLWQLIADLEHLQGAPPYGGVHRSAMERPITDAIGVAAEREGRLVGYGFALPSPDGRAWTLEVAAGSDTYGPLVEDVLDLLAARGVGEVVLWVHASGLEPPEGLVTPERYLHRMVTDLPVAQPFSLPDGMAVRGMDPAGDAPALIELNNLAFAGHPEQGGWTARDLRQRMGMPWFDPVGVRTAWIGDRLVAFHWTKLHPAGAGTTGGPVGEIYVIAVHPSYQGKGMGRLVALEGLRYLASRHEATRAILYVDDSNTAARKLYASLGFVSEHVDRAYRWVRDR